MEMTYPPPLKSKANPYSGTNVDYSMTSPLKADGSDFPCKGYLSLLDAPEGKAVASWTAGGEYNFTISGGAAHGGGSCQAALSVDGGKTFRVVHSYEGGCPGQGESSFKFGLPGDTPATEGGIFAWSWFNHLGNREMYMNCAVVDIVTGGGTRGGDRNGKGVPFSSRPELFKANIGKGCRTVDSADVAFPDPGPDVHSTGKAVPPAGTCGAAGSSSSSSGAGGATGGGHGSDSGTGSGAGTSTGTGGGYSGKHPSSTQGSSSSTITAFSPSQGDDCKPAPSLTTQPTPVPVTNESGTGWTPGNDWPGWFQSGASGASCQAYLAVFLSAMFFAHYLF
ncbi:uncharacterized protein B0T15DRAFT_410891 [Chaetomium strumarium]|uniref:Extracellular protein n=1 Tax=Chaetomium strumarium TaxID=1170767 RepID=A0AAJ0M4F1_9PEZI|nr:hypothetical protein B0T15DRAFT_410891 [Chaetomium strumarium]